MRTERNRLWGMVVVFATAVGCRQGPDSSIQLVVGRGAAEQKKFVPRTALVEYVELPGERNELRITLASYEAACDRFVPPGSGQASITVTIVTPPGEKPGAERYEWGGAEAHGGTRTQPERAYAEPTARVGSHGYILPPGGWVKLTHVGLDKPHGHVDGLLDFEFAGDATRPATSIKGRFQAKICPLGNPR